MAINYSPKIIRDGLVLCLDAANPKSYPGTGTAWTDLSGSGNNGTLVNGPVYSSANGGSIDFDASNDSSSLSSSIIPATGAFTVFFTYALTGSGGRGGFFERKAALPYNGFSFGQGGTGTWAVTISGTSDFSNNQISAVYTYPSLNQIYVDSAVYNGSNAITIYRNGTLIGTTSGATQGNLDTQGSRTNLLIANRDNITSLPCKVYNTQVYNRALSADEVKTNFNALRGRYGI